MAIDQIYSRLDTYERVLFVLQEKLSTTLFENSLPNLHLPAPEDDAYYFVDDSPVNIAKNHMVAVMIYDASDRSFGVPEGRARMSGPDGTKNLSQWNLGVSLVFRKALYDRENPVRLGNKALNSREVDKVRAELYSGCLTQTILEYAPSPGIINSLSPLGDRGSLVPSDQDYLGLATTLVEVTQDIILPSPKFTL